MAALQGLPGGAALLRGSACRGLFLGAISGAFAPWREAQFGWHCSESGNLQLSWVLRPSMWGSLGRFWAAPPIPWRQALIWRPGCWSSTGGVSQGICPGRAATVHTWAGRACHVGEGGCAVHPQILGKEGESPAGPAQELHWGPSPGAPSLDSARQEPENPS